jgi:hypothetical protein
MDLKINVKVPIQSLSKINVRNYANFILKKIANQAQK